MVSTLFSRGVFWLQRHSGVFPRVLRGALRRFIPAPPKSCIIQDWSVPLLGPERPLATANSALVPRAQEMTGGPATRVQFSALRCLLVTDTLDVGGTDEVVAFLAARLTDVGFETAVLELTEDSDRAEGVAARALRAADVPVWRGGPTLGEQKLRAWHPDVVAIHTGRPYDREPWWPFQAATAANIPVVQTLHGSYALYDAKPDFVAHQTSLADIVVSVSALLREQYLRIDRDYPKERIVVVPNAVRPRALPAREDARGVLGLDSEYLFLCLARYCLQKNTYGLVRAFARVADRYPEAHLLVAGRLDDARYAAQIRALADSLPCRDRIHLRDHLPDPALLLAAADGFVLDSFFEGWSLASLDALAAGLPVVLADVGGAREQLAGPEPPGFLVPNPLGDPLVVNWDTISRARFAEQANEDELVEAMSSLIAEREAWLARRTAIAEEARERFNPRIWVERHAEILRRAASRSTVVQPSL